MSPLPEWLLVWLGCGPLWCRSWLEVRGRAPSARVHVVKGHVARSAQAPSPMLGEHANMALRSYTCTDCGRRYDAFSDEQTQRCFICQCIVELTQHQPLRTQAAAGAGDMRWNEL
jgi:hypothetical protein